MKDELLRLLNSVDASQLKVAVIDAIAAILPETFDDAPLRRKTAPKARIAVFIFERCEVVSGAEVVKSDLYNAYHSWCQGKELPPVDPSVFSKQLTATEPAISLVRQRGKRRYLGVRLVVDTSAFSDLAELALK